MEQVGRTARADRAEQPGGLGVGRRVGLRHAFGVGAEVNDAKSGFSDQTIFTDGLASRLAVADDDGRLLQPGEGAPGQRAEPARARLAAGLSRQRKVSRSWQVTTTRSGGSSWTSWL